ncbi:membrane-fusion protein [Beggiatoa alba B18LD]|uniref:Membrane-fusion protein n=1 Tax=Beggiatoa alba B18LD TaxID=395493 RepID=I3CBL6_9GAMM|nr:efflux RND transporter periplasmic adaptor subunit [Beggiatoa alba]EIJ41009.1 membrane-fusion protein [Beggiatoa alba B18LD]
MAILIDTSPATAETPASVSNAQAAPQAMNLKLRLRDDLSFTFQSYGERPCYLIEDSLYGNYFQIGVVEYAFIQQLDGEQSVEQAVQVAPELESQQIQQICYWLIHSQLVYVWNAEKQIWFLPKPPHDKVQAWAGRLNTLFIKIPLGSPDRWLNRLLPYTRWLLGVPFFLLWLLICGTGLYLVMAQFDRFVHSASSLLLPHNAFWLLIAWIIVKVLHETAHGLVCKKYGGYIHNAGIMLILFIPIGAYMNANASWRLTSRWQRMHVSVAGMYAELFIAGIAAWIWAQTETGVLNYLSYNIVIITSISTLLFNANPLMRFDGYYILSDLLNIPNLYLSGQRYIRYLNHRYIQGRTITPPQWKPEHTPLIKTYAIASLIWRWVVIIGLLVAANHLFYGAGILIATMAGISVLILPLIRFSMSLHKDPQRGAVLRHLSLLFLFVSLASLLLLTQVHWSRTLTAPAVFDYANAQIVRTETAGFIKKIHVKTGDIVAKDDILLELDNPDLYQEEKDLALQIQHRELRRQHAITQGQLSDAQGEIEKLQDLQHQYQEKQLQIASLTLKANQAGTIIAPDLRDLLGVYTQRGTEVLTLANPQALELKASIPQTDIDAFRAYEGQTVQIYRHSQPLHTFNATLSRVNPSASQTILHPALTVLAGGELPVKPKTQQSERDSSAKKDNSDNYEYLAPRFTATIALSTDIPKNIYAGETATIYLASPPQSLGELLWIGIERYIKRLQSQAT